MEHHVYKHIQVTGTSGKSMEDAVQVALNKVAESVKNLRWFEVIETRGAVDNNTVAEWQVTVRVAFTVE